MRSSSAFHFKTGVQRQLLSGSAALICLMGVLTVYGSSERPAPPVLVGDLQLPQWAYDASEQRMTQSVQTPDESNEELCQLYTKPLVFPRWLPANLYWPVDPGIYAGTLEDPEERCSIVYAQR